MSDNFEGAAKRYCGEHRTLGGRAWCHDCREYCAPVGLCHGCERPQFEAALWALVEAAEAMHKALALSVPDNATSPLIWHVRNTIAAATAARRALEGGA